MSYAVVLVPDFSLQAILRTEPSLAGRPVALAEGEGRQARVSQASPAAVAVEVGLAVTLAMARCPGLLVRPRDFTAEAEAERLLTAAAFTLSPRVERTAPGCRTIDLQGTAREATGERVNACLAVLTSACISARVGVADTPLLASYAARCADPVLVVDDTRGFLGPLALAFAEPTPEQSTVLQGWGVKTLGQLTDIPKPEIGRRLGTDGVALWERAAGQAARVLCLTEPSRQFVAEWAYDPPVETLEPLHFAIRRHADRVALELRGAGFVAEQLSLVLLLEDDSDVERDFRLPEPGVDVDGWMRIVHGYLETVRTESRVSGVRLAARPARPTVKQDGLFDTGLRDPAAFFENLARMGAIVGDENVGTPILSDTWRPDAVELGKPPASVPAPEPEPIHAPHGLTLRRFRPPWQASVELAVGVPASINADGTVRAVRAARGPFRGSGDWWDPRTTWSIEVWHLEVTGGIIYQAVRTGREWQIEGVLD